MELRKIKECIAEIYNSNKDNVKDFDVVIPMSKLKDHSDKLFKSFWTLQTILQRIAKR